jgi:gluconolactonase
VTRPNGLVFSPDFKTLYVSDNSGDPSGSRALVAYPVNADGSFGPRKVLFDFGKERGIDGMAVATDGTIVATAGRGPAAGVYFFNPEGKKIGFEPTPEDPSNCCFGGKNRKTLYITAGKSLYRIETTLTGAPTAPR